MDLYKATLAMLLAAGVGTVALSRTTFAQRGQAAAPAPPVWVPRIKPGVYVAPNRPHVKLTELKARHAGQANWREVIVDDGRLQGEYISAAPGTKTPKSFHPDTRVFWSVVEGQMTVEIEGQEPVLATKSSLVQVPKQTLYSIETTGSTPSLRFEVNVSKAKTLYPQTSTAEKPPAMPGFEWVSMNYRPRAAAYDNGNVPHVNLFEVAKASANFTRNVVRDTASEVLFIYGSEKDLPPLNVNDKGHLHPESAEFWLIMTGQIRHAIETLPPFIADEGDIVFAPPGTLHATRFAGPGPSCRLSITEFQGNSAITELPAR